MPSPNIWIAASDNDIASVAKFLAVDPNVANSRDENGYTPIHAAASYNHLQLLRSLVNTHGGDINIPDDEGDSPLFAVETVETARCLVEELGADVNHRNREGLTAAEVIEEDGQFPLVAAYLREKVAATTSSGGNESIPKPPPNVQVNLSTIEDETDSLPPVDSALRERIEALAQRNDFQSKEAQQELRELVRDSVREHVVEPEVERSVRRREDGL